ncbi:MAG TPA: hypothetical protein VH328_01085 [Burkholderiaceae bacterium]|nr:hypothetical protein [Burkholderiaceae bacterium]
MARLASSGTRLADIRLQKLFTIVLLLKVAASGFAWALHQPWTLGFALPLALMLAYIVLGLNRREDDVPDEKFADSCYYLGFIFTITSIIFALFDLPEVGTRLDEIAVRFGAAMASTVLGLGVRVYLVSFELDTHDALRDAENAVVDAARRLREQLGLALDRMRDFEAEVDLAAKGSIERANLRLDGITREQGERLAAWFDELAQRHRPAMDAAIAEVEQANGRLASTFEGHVDVMRTHLEGVDAMVNGFLEALQKRLDASMFPPDYFAKYLAGPLAQLRSASEEIAQQVHASAGSIAQSSGALVEASRKLHVRATSTEGAFEVLARLGKQQELAAEGAQRVHRDEIATHALVTEAVEQIGSRLDAVVRQLQALNREGAEPRP